MGYDKVKQPPPKKETTLRYRCDNCGYIYIVVETEHTGERRHPNCGGLFVEASGPSIFDEEYEEDENAPCACDMCTQARFDEEEDERAAI